MMVGQTEWDGLPEHGAHGAVPALLQVSEEEGFLLLSLLEEIPDGVRTEGVRTDDSTETNTHTHTHSTSDCWLTYSFRYLQIMPATFSQFFLVGQNTRHECFGMTSVTKAIMWSGSIFCIELEY